MTWVPEVGQALLLSFLLNYDVVVVAMSGGKDSVACLLYLLELGVPRDRIELHHHLVDGREGSELMDWPVTEAYCRAVARAFGLPVYMSWKEGGFEREMLRQDAYTAGYAFEVPGGGLRRIPSRGGKRSTRRMFPQVSADLSVRWCSAYLKIMVMDAVLRNQRRFDRRRTLVVTGERAEESSARAAYATFEPHRADLRGGKKQRLVDHWRPVHGWSERQVWEILERWRVNVHPAYRLGFGRVSCARCIFGNPDQWASARAVDTGAVQVLADYEVSFGKTIHRKLPVLARAAQGTPYPMDKGDLRAARSKTFDELVILPPGSWKLPAGAYGDTCGPT